MAKSAESQNYEASRQPLLGNGPANTANARQWLSSRHAMTTTYTHATTGVLFQSVPTVSRSVCLGIKHPSEACDHIFIIITKYYCLKFEALSPLTTRRTTGGGRIGYLRCLRLSHSPKPWKETKVITLPNPGNDPTFLKNVRLINPLSATGKLFEKVKKACLMQASLVSVPVTA
jgi:hypothetical protein